MQNKDQIAELFKETFQDFEAPVRPELWQQVASKIQTPTVTPGADAGNVTQIAAVTSKMTGGMMTWIAAATILVTVTTAYYLYTAEPKTGTEPVTQHVPVNADIITEKSAPMEEIFPVTGQPVAPGTVNTSTEVNFNQETATHNPEAIDALTSENSTAVSEKEVITHQSALQHEAIVNPRQDKISVSTVTNSTPNHNTGTIADNPVKIKVHATPASGPAPLEVNFTTTSAGDQEWQFGDGSETVKGNQATHIYKQPGNYLVTVQHTDENGRVFTDLVKIEVLSDLTIDYIPNIFTPNGDGVNDVFQITTSKDIDIEVSIFDKTGKFVYKFSGVENSWNGKINNLQDAGEGTYFYVIFATGQNGEQHTQKGTITLKR